MQSAFVRGSFVRFIVVPDILRNAPLLKRAQAAAGAKGATGAAFGKGQATHLAARARDAAAQREGQFNNRMR